MLNFNNVGKPICVITGGGKYDKKVISLDADADDKTYFNKLKISNDSKFCPVPNTKSEREIVYITGCSGSGKSTFTRMYLEQYKKKYKTREIYMFSSLKRRFKSRFYQAQKIHNRREFIYWSNQDRRFKRFSIYIDVISNKKIKDAVYDNLNQALEIGRHFGVTIVVTNHLPTNGIYTRRILNEASLIVYFPQSAGGKIKYLLSVYLDIDKTQIKYWKQCHTRWVCIGKNYKQYYITEHEVSVLNLDSESENETDKHK